MAEVGVADEVLLGHTQELCSELCSALPSDAVLTVEEIMTSQSGVVKFYAGARLLLSFCQGETGALSDTLTPTFCLLEHSKPVEKHLQWPLFRSQSSSFELSPVGLKVPWSSGSRGICRAFLGESCALNQRALTALQPEQHWQVLLSHVVT
jgi:hypothetical protein